MAKTIPFPASRTEARRGNHIEGRRTPDPAESARAAGLHYTTDTRPGIVRRRNGRGFVYLAPTGKRVRDRRELERIRQLVIPPAWTDVWICPDPRGHLQATGRDARARKQHRYHARWREVRDETKYHRLIGFARALPGIRRRTAADLRKQGLKLEKVVAAVVQLLEKTLIRVGNDEYARQNRSFGLTTLRDGHVEVKGGRVRFAFRGKSGVEHEVDLDDRRLARVVRQCQDLPGYDLFQYLDESGERHTIGSSDVNEYLRRVTGHEFTSKDFRTWAGTVLAAQLLQAVDFESDSHARKNIVRAVEEVAKRLGNTQAVCRKCYIHPAIFESYLDGTIKALARRAKGSGRAADAWLAAEAGVLNLLQRWAKVPRRRAS
jgi:DNA topoisomerase-1